jgi:tRNA pseudouridine38-40 synthase
MGLIMRASVECGSPLASKFFERWLQREFRLPIPAIPCFARAVDSQKFKLTIAFDGTAYQGWQSQRSGMGVQDFIECALAKLFKSAPKLQASSRTDAGVHARSLVAHFEIPTAEFIMPIRHLALAINAGLPDDIRVKSAFLAAPDFNARFDAKGKQYRYRVWNHPVMNPLLRTQSWHVPTQLDLAKMRVAASALIGRHDFRSFTANRGDVLEDAVRSLTRCEIKRSGPSLTFIIEGEGFLYKMCRGIVGTLVQIGTGKIPADSMEMILKQQDRTAAGMNAPAHGLILWKVFY